MRLPIQVAIYCVRPGADGWQYLMLHRLLKRLTFWQGVTGGVESGEKIHETAQRELTEETGFTVTPESIGFTYTFPVDEFFENMYETPPDEITQHVFVARVAHNAEPVLDPVEHDDYQWCDFDTALAMLYWWDDKESIRRVSSYLAHTES